MFIDILWAKRKEDVYKDFDLRAGDKVIFAKQDIFEAEPISAVVVGEYPYIISIRVTFEDTYHPGKTNSYIVNINKCALFLGELLLQREDGSFVI